MIKVLIVILVILGGLFLVGGGYYLGLQSPQDSKTLSDNSSDLTSPSPTVLPSPFSSEIASLQSTQDAAGVLEEVFDNKNFDDLRPYLAEKVNLVTYATECCGETSDLDEVIDFVSGHGGDIEGWTINPQGEEYQSLMEKFDIYALSDGGQALGFKLNEDEKIEDITFFIDYRLSED